MLTLGHTRVLHAGRTASLEAQSLQAVVSAAPTGSAPSEPVQELASLTDRVALPDNEDCEEAVEPAGREAEQSLFGSVGEVPGTASDSLLRHQQQAPPSPWRRTWKRPSTGSTAGPSRTCRTQLPPYPFVLHVETQIVCGGKKKVSSGGAGAPGARVRGACGGCVHNF